MTSMPPISVEIYTKQERGGVVGLNKKQFSSSSKSRSPPLQLRNGIKGHNRDSQHLGNTESSDDSRKRFLKESKRLLQQDTRKLHKIQKRENSNPV